MKPVIFYFDGCPPAFVNQEQYFPTKGYSSGIMLKSKNTQVDGNFIISHDRPITLSDYSIYFEGDWSDD